MAAWSEEVDEILGGDLTTALAYVTPAGGTVVTAVAPIGLRDRDAGTLTFTTSLGFGRKLERLKRNPRVALAYHSREHGFASGGGYVLVQGTARAEVEPDERYLREVIGPAAERFLGARKEGFFWDRWLREYYADRVPVHVDVERVTAWPDLRGSGGVLPGGEPEPQAPPAKGIGPRVATRRAAARLAALPHVLLGFVGADGLPVVVPIDVLAVDQHGIRIDASAGLLPVGGRRAGILAHSYEPQLIGLAARQHTGWLEVDQRGVAVYAAHTETGFKAPANKTVLLLANGFLAKRGLRKARREGRVPSAGSAGTSPT